MSHDKATINPTMQYGNLHSKLSQSMYDASNSASGGASVVFNALTHDSSYAFSGVETGTGAMSTTRASALNVMTDTGYYTEIAANAPAIHGARYVTNVLNYSEDFGQSDWWKGSTSSATGNELTFGGAGSSYRIEYDAANKSDLYATFVVVSMYVPPLTGWSDNTATMTLSNQTALGDNGIEITSADADSWVTIHWFDISGNRVPRLWSDKALVITGIKLQAEITQGRDDLFAPSEYQATSGSPVTTPYVNRNGYDMRIGSQLVDDPNFNTPLDGNHWLTGSGTAWSIADGELVGTAAGASDDIYQSVTGFETGKTYMVECDVTVTSGSFFFRLHSGDAYGSSINIGVSGKQTAYVTIDTLSGGAIDRLYVIGQTPFTGTVNSVRIYEWSSTITQATGSGLREQPIARRNTALTQILTYSRDVSNWTSAPETPVFDQVGIDGTPNTGVTVHDTNASGNRMYQHLHGTYSTSAYAYRVWIKVEDTQPTYVCGLEFQHDTDHLKLGLNQYNGTVWDDSSTGSYNYEVYRYGDYWCVYADTPSNASSNRPVVRVIPARYDSLWNANVNHTGTCIIGQAEIYEHLEIADIRHQPPVFTTTGSVSTSSTEMSFDIANHDADLAAYYMEVEFAEDYSESVDNRSFLYLATSGKGFYTNSTLSRVRFSPTTGDWTFVDNTVWSNKQIHKAAASYSDSDSSALFVFDGTNGNEVSNFGSTTGTAIELFKSRDFQCGMRNLKRYTASTYDELKTQVNADMVEYITGDSFTDTLTDSSGNLLTVA